MHSDNLIETLHARLVALFTVYTVGSDVTPAERYRTEGFAEALIAAGLLDTRSWAAMIEETFLAVTGEPLPGFDSQQPFIPLLMARAPVFPSTKA